MQSDWRQQPEPRVNVLLVDDRAENLVALEAILSELGQNLVRASSGREALKLLLDQSFALILLDVDMPGLDGIETAALIRKRESSRHIPIIFITAGDRAEPLVFAGYSTGAVDYLWKPIAPEILRAKVGVFVELAKKTQALEAEIRRREQVESALQAAQAELKQRIRARTESLRQSEERFRLLVEGTRDYAIMMLDVEGRIVSWNLGGMFMFGYSTDDVLGRHYSLIYRGEDVEQGNPETELRGSLCDGRVIGEGLRVRKDGSQFWARCVTTALVDGSGKLRGYGVVVRDLTERRAAEEELRHREEQLRQSQKLDAIGRLAGGVAHDFNNMLAVINGYAELMLAGLPEENPHYQPLNEMWKAGRRAADLTRQLLALSRQQVLEPRLFDLNSLVADMEKMLRRLIGEDVQLTTILAPQPCPVFLDPGQIEQVLLNLAVNARDAMPQGGCLTIRTRHAVDPGSLPAGVPGPCVMLEVADTGCGMDAATQSRIFEPFFTTKDYGKGTGLGLATVYGVVTQSGGAVKVCSAVNAGTTFEVFLPRAKGAARAVAESPAAAPLFRGSETILLVEDEAMVRRLVHDALVRAGYSVLEAKDGREALSLIQRHAGPLHLLLTDVVMPGMSGRELAERLVKTIPGLKVLFMSGYTDDAVVRHGVMVADAAFIQKPFSPGDLTQKVREVLADSFERSAV